MKGKKPKKEKDEGWNKPKADKKKVAKVIDQVAYKGPVDLVLLDFFGGLRSACTCAPARDSRISTAPYSPHVSRPLQKFLATPCYH